MIEESKCCSDVIKKYFNKEPVMTKKDNKDFESFTKCWICKNDYIDGDVKVRDHFISLENIEALHIEIGISMSN